jgi:4-amino-4-deoxy-L-arabinose transferase-like glycosyltransferase
MVMLLAGQMIRDLGGGRWAQVLGAVAVTTTPNAIVQGGLFRYETFDYLCWVLLAYMVVRLLKTDDARWWLRIGAAIGLGMLTNTINHRAIYVCHNLRQTWPEFWQRFQYFD